MNFLQRALKSVTRKKGRSIILFLVIFILGNVIAGSVAIEQSTKNVEKETKRQMGATATIAMDYEKLDHDQQKNPEKFEDNDDFWKSPNIEVYEQIGQLPYVKYFDYSIPSQIGTDHFKGFQSDYVSYGDGIENHFNIKGVNRKEVVDIDEGLIKLQEGETFSDKDIKEGTNSVLVSKEVAEQNNLSVGDQVVLDVVQENYWMDPSGNSEEADSEETDSSDTTDNKIRFDFPVKVIGIFSIVKKEETAQTSEEEQGYSEDEWMATEQINTIYFPNELVKQLNSQLNDEIMKVTQLSEEETGFGEDFYNATYVLKSPDDVEAFREEADALIPQEYYHVVAASDQYDQVAGGMQKLGTISKYVVIIAVAATIMIITLVVLLFLRDRKHELGIYLSLGEGRGKIIGQVVIELLVISALALVLSLVTGKFLGGIVSDSLLQTDWLSNANSMDGMYYGSSLMSTDISYQDIQDAYQINFSAGYIISYLGLGLGTVLLSAVMPLLYILRLNPKKIMM